MNWNYIACGVYLLVFVLPVVIALDIAHRRGNGR